MNARTQSPPASRNALARAGRVLVVAAFGANAWVAQAAGDAGVARPGAAALSPAGVAECSEELRRSRAQWKYWPGDVHGAIERLALLQKELFEGRCAGHPQARAYLETAERLREHARGIAPPDSVSASPLAADAPMRRR